MIDDVPRLRMFAGPNGSGKSTTIRSLIQKPAEWYGIYLNADDIEKQVRDHQQLSIADFGLSFKPVELIETLLQKFRSYEKAYIPKPPQIQFQEGILTFTGFVFDSYHAAALVEILRHQALTQRKSFTFETVMSHPSKVEFLAEARAVGYRTYLYLLRLKTPQSTSAEFRIVFLKAGTPFPKIKFVVGIKTRLGYSKVQYEIATEHFFLIQVKTTLFILQRSPTDNILISKRTNSPLGSIWSGRNLTFRIPTKLRHQGIPKFFRFLSYSYLSFGAF